MAFASILILFGHWWDFFQMVKIGPYKDILDHAAGAHGGEHGTTGAAEHGAEAAGQVAEAAHGAAEHGTAVVAQGVETLQAKPSKAEIVETEKGAKVVKLADAGKTETAKAVVGWSAPGLEEIEEISKEGYFHYSPDTTTGFGLPGFLELGTFIGFLSLFVFATFSQMTKAPLLPANDPYIEESLHLVS